MKKTLLSFVVILSFLPFLAKAQWSGTNPGPIYYNSGNVGIGTTTPDANLHVYDPSGSRPGGVTAPTKSVFKLSRSGTAGSSYAESGEFRIGHGGPGVWGSQLDLFLNGASNQNDIPDQQVMTWLYNGNVGIGTTKPATNLHIVGTGVSIDVSSQTSNSGLIIQANTPTRSTTSGAQLEFVIPAVADGTSPWGQGRIITVAGSTNSPDLTGKMILGTRRLYNKIGIGNQWYYGDDITIDAMGRVGIGTLTPDAQLAVNGTIHTQEIKVDMTGWSDYVFKPTYKLPSLSAVKAYIDQNQHLPEVPSEADVKKDGVDLGEMNKLLLKKVEELTLYLIEQNKQLESQHTINQTQQEQLDQLKQQINLLTQKKN